MSPCRTAGARSCLGEADGDALQDGSPVLDGDLLTVLDEALQTEALALALESSDAVVILDDALARQVAATVGVRFTGTLGLLLDAKRAAEGCSCPPSTSSSGTGNVRPPSRIQFLRGARRFSRPAPSTTVALCLSGCGHRPALCEFEGSEPSPPRRPARTEARPPRMPARTTREGSATRGAFGLPQLLLIKPVRPAARYCWLFALNWSGSFLMTSPPS